MPEPRREWCSMLFLLLIMLNKIIFGWVKSDHNGLSTVKGSNPAIGYICYSAIYDFQSHGWKRDGWEGHIHGQDKFSSFLFTTSWSVIFVQNSSAGGGFRDTNC